MRSAQNDFKSERNLIVDSRWFLRSVVFLVGISAIVPALHAARDCPEDCRCTLDLKVDCSNGTLRQLPSGIDSQVKYLDLSDNLLTGVPTEINRFRHLEELNISRNFIGNLDGIDFGLLTELRIIDLSYNDLSIADLDESAIPAGQTVVIIFDDANDEDDNVTFDDQAPDHQSHPENKSKSLYTRIKRKGGGRGGGGGRGRGGSRSSGRRGGGHSSFFFFHSSSGHHSGGHYYNSTSGWNEGSSDTAFFVIIVFICACVALTIWILNQVQKRESSDEDDLHSEEMTNRCESRRSSGGFNHLANSQQTYYQGSHSPNRSNWNRDLTTTNNQNHDQRPADFQSTAPSAPLENEPPPNYSDLPPTYDVAITMPKVEPGALNGQLPSAPEAGVLKNDVRSKDNS